MLVKFARAKWTICRRQRRTKALGGSRQEETTRDLLSRNPEGLKGRAVADFGLGNWGLSRDATKKTLQN